MKVGQLYMRTSFEETPIEKIITLLRSSQSEFVSGEKISKSLNLSRAAVWKNIRTIQRLGYKIQSKSGAGYKLNLGTLRLLPWEISHGLQTDIIGRKIYYFDTIGSTQDFALQLAEKPHENGSVVIAEKQTSGRGRLNRKWISPKGGIWLSILLRPNFEISQVSIFQMVTSLALAIAIEKTLKLKPRIKWPNDLILNNKKVAGILIDTSVESNKIDYMIIGVGINFRIEPMKILKLIKNSDRHYPIATLIRKNDKSDPVRLVQEFLLQLEQLYNTMISGNLELIRKEWLCRSSILGKNVIVSTHNGLLKGKAITIDKDGALILAHKGKTSKLLVGDILQ